MELVVSGSGTGVPLVIEADESDTIAVLKEKIVENWPEGHVLLDVTLVESDCALPDSSTLLELGITAGARIIGHRCKNIAVGVTYNRLTHRHDFRASVTVGHVLEWALSKYGIDPTELPDFELQFGAPPKTVPDDTPLADVPHPECSIAFNLVRTVFPRG